MNKDLKTKAIKIKGKDYVQVKDRIAYFNEQYSNGMIQSKILTDLLAHEIIILAKVIPDIKNPDRFFTGYASETKGKGLVNSTSALENAETSAVGRALAMMGIGVIDSVASADEVNNAIKQQTKQQLPPNTNAQTGEVGPAPTCKIHNKEMGLRTNKHTGHQFYSCGTKLSDGRYCPNTSASNRTLEEIKQQVGGQK